MGAGAHPPDGRMGRGSGAAALLLLPLLLGLASGATTEAWRSRTVYQVLTDRFATDVCWGASGGNPNRYMGGTFAGLRKRMDYIKHMGFDAVWWSPVMAQGTDAFDMTGYAGYWPGDFYDINPAFGTKRELVELVDAYHAAGMFVLFDLVINHVGYGVWESYSPFNKTTDFHDCNGCFTLNCEPDPAGAFSAGNVSMHSFEHCKLSGLPDLNHSDASILERMVAWQTWTQKTFKPDGLRYDAATNSLPSFVAALTEAANGTWTIGELFLEDPLAESDAYIAAWIKRKRGAHSAFSFPMQHALRLAIGAANHSMVWLAEQRVAHLQRYGPTVHDLGVFIENHDMERWLHDFPDVSRYMNGLAYVLFAEGIPFIYYGAEHGFTEERAPLWPTRFQHNTGLWLFIRISVHYRRAAEVWDAGIAATVHADNHTLVLRRGPFVLALTSAGERGGGLRGASISLPRLGGGLGGKTLRNIYDPEARAACLRAGLRVQGGGARRGLAEAEAHPGTRRAARRAQDVLRVSAGGVGVFVPSGDGRPQVFYDGPVVEPMSLYIPTKDPSLRLNLLFITFLALLPAVVLLALVLAHCWAAMALRPGGWRGLPCCGCAAAPPLHGAPSSFTDGKAFAAEEPSQNGTRRGVWLPRLLRSSGRSRGGADGAADASDGSDQVDVHLEPPVSRSVLHGQLHAMSIRQALAAGSVAHSDRRAPSAQSGASLPSRLEAFSGASNVFRHAGQVSAIDLAQGLVLEDGERLSAFAAAAGVADSDSVSSRPPSSIQIGSPRGGLPGGVGGGRLSSMTIIAGLAARPDRGAGGAASPPAPPRPPPAAPRAAPAPAGGGSVAASTWAKLAGRLSPVGSSGSGSRRSGAGVGAAVPPFDAFSTPILHVALEYSLPHLGLTNQLMFGGLGMVVDTFLREWPGPLSLIAPLYRPCYEPLPGAPPPDGAAGGGADAGAGAAPGGWRGLVPTVLPPGAAPLLEMTVDVAGWQLPVEVFKLEAPVAPGGPPRTYYLVQAELFARRRRGDIYAFTDEDEMLTWLAVFNQAVAATIVAEGVTAVQLHDYHGGLSLCYIPQRLQPAVLYVAHNAHYTAAFAIPTPARRNKVYQHLGLNAEALARFVEHNGCLDMLACVIRYLRTRQEGRGAVAVSPRYASQIANKLSVFWQLAPAGRPRHIGGVLNALSMADSFAASGLSTDAVLAAKAEAKACLQAAYGLAVGDNYTLLTFVGRVTHQKGCDIIAEAAPYIMSRHPTLQLVFAGPTGDSVGAAAASKLAALAERYPDRMYCPQDYYVAGDEKHMILSATDFALAPSRFEPCGLVDIEFGWNAGLIIGHDTGGLGKMPGVYFDAQASHLSHLARKLEEAVDGAMRLTREQRAAMAGEALARRFPADAMMEAYAGHWAQIHAAHCRAARARARARVEALHDHAAFFASKWAQVNLKAARPPATSVGVGGGCGASDAAEAVAKAGSAAGSAGPLGGTIRLHPAPGSAAGGAAGSEYAASHLLTVGGPPPPPRWRGCRPPPWLRSWPGAVRLSNYLLVVQHHAGLGPGVMLCTFFLLEAIRIDEYHLCGLYATVPRSLNLATDLFRVPVTQGLLAKLMLYFLVASVCAPFWFWVAAVLRPRAYIRLSSLAMLASWLLVFLGIRFSDLLGIVVVPVAAASLVGSPLLSLGFLGEDDVEVSEVGRQMLALSEVTKYSLLALGMLFASVATNADLHQAAVGVGMCWSGAVAAWFWYPASLSEAYRHLALTYKGQKRLLKHLACFWLTLVSAACDSLSFMLVGFMVLLVSKSLDAFASFQAVVFGGCAAAVLWNFLLLRSRTAELRLTRTLLALAAMPGYELAKAALVLGLGYEGTAPVNGAISPVLLGVAAALATVMGGRDSVQGLVGFLTLPSREVVSMWQIIAIMLGVTTALLLIGISYAASILGGATSATVLLVIVAGLEVLRAACMWGIARRFPGENLSAP
ncbi:mok12 [Scenedesmus sp. PABB004]|nr:mok12 [Scenedesmus sp. PABB004]